MRAQRSPDSRSPVSGAGSLVVLAVLLLAVGTAPAHGAEQHVQVKDDFFQAATTAVKPGEAVTWTLTDGVRPHNVTFDDGTFSFPSPPQFAVWGVTRTFPVAGIYRYHCQVHGAPGGLGMSGIVHVNAAGTIPGAPPTASFTVSKAVAAVGEPVALNASASTDPDGTITKHEWDFDGNGLFDSDTGSGASTSFTPFSAGLRTIALRVTDSQGHTAQTTRQLTVTHRPTPQLNITPAPAHVDQTVSFDASASSDADGTIAKFEWDLDGNGSFETDTGASATTARSYGSAATLSITVRATDNLGVTGTVTRLLQVVPPPVVDAPGTPPAPPPPPAPPTVTAPAAQPSATAGCSTLSGAQRAACMQRSCRALTGARRASCISRSCRYLKGARRASCIQTSCRHLAKSRRAACARASCRFLTGAQRSACVRRYRKP